MGSPPSPWSDLRFSSLQCLFCLFHPHFPPALQPSYQPQFNSIQLSCSVISDSLQPHGLQHARLPCPNQLLELAQTHVHRVSDPTSLQATFWGPYPPLTPVLMPQLDLNIHWPAGVITSTSHEKLGHCYPGVHSCSPQFGISVSQYLNHLWSPISETPW